MFIPENVKTVMDMLKNAGYEAFAVGGCVRDFLLGKTPFDYDITTSAKPEETKEVFKNEHVIETGIKHGTVTVLINREPIEITTFRVDCDYSDNRHPSKVLFTSSVKEDLARRDFTINALAYCESTGIVDVFGGVSDLEHRIIRCVGDPDARFSEDALRIMRGLRFSSVLGFEIEEETAASIHRNKNLLKNISAERLTSELTKLLCGDFAEKVLLEYSDVISVLISELSVLIGFDQHHFRHDKDAFCHTAAVVSAVPPVLHLRLAALLHDVAKPKCFSLDENGTGHFFGHAPAGAQISAEILSRLKFDNETKEAVSTLILHHEDRFEPEAKPIKRALSKLGSTAFFDLIALMQADDIGKKPEYCHPKSYFDEFRLIAKEIIKNEECFSLKHLAVNGGDLASVGIAPGPKMGAVLQKLLEEVISENLPNKKASLIAFAKEYYKSI